MIIAKARIVGAAVLAGGALTACISILGLDNDKFISLEEQVCFQFATLCTDRAETYAFPRDKIACKNELTQALRKPGSDPSRPSADLYANLHCRSKATCVEYLDCLAQSNFITGGSMCATSDCLGGPGDASVPWRCCSNEQCTEIENASGCLSTTAFPCVGKVTWPMPDPFDAGVIDLSLTFADINNMTQLVEPLVVKACSRLDTTCLTPIDTSPGANPHKLKVPYAFDGYFQATYTPTDGGGGTDDYMPLLVMAVPPVTSFNTMGPMSAIPMFRRMAYTAIVQSVGNTVDSTQGHIFGNARTCAFLPAANVTGGLDSDAGRLMYFAGMQPAPMQMQTDNGGQFGFINVPPGLRILTTRVNGVRTGSVGVLVRADTLTFAYLPPTP